MKNNILLLVILAFILNGCALQTIVKKRNLDVQTKMSETIFLDPVAIKDQIAYVRVRNTTDKDINIEDIIKNTLAKQNFVLTQDPAKANFIIQANLLQIGKSDQRSAASALTGGFGGAVAGAVIGNAIGLGSSGPLIAAGLIGAVAGIVGDALVEDTYFTMITDIEVRQRALNGEIVQQVDNLNSKLGTSGNSKQIVESKTSWRKYRTRIVSVANQVNLKFEEAKSSLTKGLIRSISGIL
ncbi:MAG: hypothetical protein HFP81_03710 [Methylococcales symbiont of Hymedesmia sp. n. MRB-2018]|nr:MAG: hypothetical protein HFP78_04770 [Methylococcales symbiont of Hymedesmia sp. n. MRB-2018]KAF3984156.1 MAG: hypothetical protein HFP81_03710 [Methylococcales symbiont of Hymedesmia sp. n. MRB-2018]